LNQILVELPGRDVTQSSYPQLESGAVRVGSGEAMKERRYDRCAALSAYGNAAFAILYRFHGIFAWQLALGAGNRGERLSNNVQGGFGIELSRDNQDRIVGLIVLLVESAQLFDIDVFHV